MAEIKKEAVPVPSVAADGEQLNQGNDCPLTLEEMHREMQRMNALGYMHTVTLNQLHIAQLAGVAVSSVRFSFWRTNAPSALPSRPVVPEIISNLSLAGILQV